MGFVELLVTASVPVLTLLLLTALGSFLATSHAAILGPEARKHLNNVVFYVFSPALVLSNLSTTTTMESMILLWFMPINILLTFIAGSAFGWIVVKVTSAPSHLRGLILGCSAAGNLGNMLFIILPVICKERGSPFGTTDNCRAYSLTYASLSMAIGAILIWSYVYNLVRMSSDDAQVEFDTGNSYTRECAGSIEGKHFTESDLAGTSSKVSFLDKARKLWSVLLRIIDFKKLFAPSTIGVMVGFVIGVVPSIKQAFIGQTAPLRVIRDSVDLLSEGAIPTMSLIMGGNLIKGLHGSGIRFSIVLGVLVIRYIMLPLTGILIVKGAIGIGLLHDDPLYHFILLLQYALPPAMNISTMTQLFGTGEGECSVILLWSYAFASVSLTLWSTLFMWLVSTNRGSMQLSL